MLSKWLNPITSRNFVPRVDLSGAAETVLDSLRETGAAVARQRDAGIDFARALSTDVLASSRRAGRSARQLVEQRPVETVLLVAATAFAIGWVVRHLRKNRAMVSAPARAARRAPAKKVATKR